MPVQFTVPETPTFVMAAFALDASPTVAAAAIAIATALRLMFLVINSHNL
ncbi:hypothetical protein [Nocardioides sp. InS609-2]|nr:hypothetical protein [Nocardioides sp. InS609-2]